MAHKKRILIPAGAVGATVAFSALGPVVAPASAASEPETQKVVFANARAEHTQAQARAISAAHRYLATFPFSRTGLTEQLTFAGYSEDEAETAIERLAIDWHEQAARMAKDYMQVQQFGWATLVDQLVFEGFTHEEAIRGAGAVSL